MRGDLNNRREEQKEIKGKPPINVGMTQLSTPGSLMRSDNDRREKKERK